MAGIPLRFPWSDDQIATLKHMHAADASSAQIARALGTTARSIESKAWRIGLGLREAFDWSDARVAILSKMAAEGASTSEIAAALSGPGLVITRMAVIGKARRLGIELKCSKAGRPHSKGGPRKAAAKVAPAPVRMGGFVSEGVAVVSPPMRAKVLPAVGVEAPSSGAIAPPSPARGEGSALVALALVFEAPAAAGERVSLIDLRSHHCRWPFDGPEGFLFCGEVRQGESSYCPEHRARSVAAPRVRASGAEKIRVWS